MMEHSRLLGAQLVQFGAQLVHSWCNLVHRPNTIVAEFARKTESGLHK